MFFDEWWEEEEEEEFEPEEAESKRNDIEEAIEAAIKEACGEGYVFIEQSGGYPWNAYCIAKDGIVHFQAGGYWEYLKKLKEELEKRRLTNTDLYNHVTEELAVIEREWRRFMQS